MRYFWILLLLLAAPAIGKAQTETLFGPGGLNSTGLWYRIPYNYSFYADDSERLSGGLIALEFNNDFYLGWGWQRQFGRTSLDQFDEDFKIVHNGLALGLTPGGHRLVHPSISMLLGSGEVRLFDDDRDDKVFVFMPSLGLEINLTTWFHLGLEGGYRLVSDVSIANLENGDVSAPFVQMDLRFGIDW